MQPPIASRRIVLLGIGHTNAHVVRMWRMNPLPDCELVCVTDFYSASYSGMLPAYLAGQVSREQMHIDLVQLTAAPGIQVVRAKVDSIDHHQRQITFADRPPLGYDILSIGIGSVPADQGVSIDEDSLLRIKPMQTFADRVDRASKALVSRGVSAPHVTVVGGGAAGVEIAFCLPNRLRQHFEQLGSLQLITRSEMLLPDLPRRARRLVQQKLAAQGVGVQLATNLVEVAQSGVVAEDGQRWQSDLVIWATGAVAGPLLKSLPFEKDERGFLLTDSTLQLLGVDGVFAVGDSGTIEGEQLAKAGVYAVRQGPVLWKNLARALEDQPLRHYRPQRRFLKLINTGDGEAIGTWHWLSFGGRWVKALKQHIDEGFIAKFAPKPMEPDDQAMQCKGCGCKLPSASLSAVLADASTGETPQFEDAVLLNWFGAEEAAAPLPNTTAPDVSLHLKSDSLDDVLGLPGQQPVSAQENSSCSSRQFHALASTDFFTCPLDDPYVSGRLAALHCCSDVLASGGLPRNALANVVVPEGRADRQQEWLKILLAGVRRELAVLGAELSAGHTIVGPRAEVGLTIIGQVERDGLMRKGNLAPGDQLVLTKPIGTAVLLAAAMRGLCRASEYENLLEIMLLDQSAFPTLARQHGISAATDVTGFGLAGHAIEMLRGSNLSATLNLSKIAALPGAERLSQLDVVSTLFEDNRRATAGSIDDRTASERERQVAAKFRLLFDPQTCGGFLVGLPGARAQSFCDHIAVTTGVEASIIGTVTKRKAWTLAIES